MTTTQNVGSAEESKNLSQVIKIDEAQIKNHRVLSMGGA
jgi:hypothetical protein